ncbi:MAG TPA: hypothetical protein VLT45_01275 [Kofleriaceae bacterium]|nr:hypothetical protein [Kofleriaceae bacterium]
MFTMLSTPISIVPDGDVEDVVRAEHRAVIALFETQLAKVAFPDVDAALLRRHADELRAAACAVENARAALEAAQHKLAERDVTLQHTVTRGLAYARIYAEAHPEIEAAIAALSVPAPAPPPAVAAKRRGRPPRASAELFATPTPEEQTL